MSPRRPLRWHGPHLALVLAAAIGTGPALAQKMYRCGSVYQDRPCTGADTGRVVGSAAPGTTGPALSARCARRGEAAARLMWARESGRTQEDQLARVRDPLERELLPQVYALPGNTAAVRGAVEAACHEDEARQALPAETGASNRPVSTPSAPVTAADGAPAATPAAPPPNAGPGSLSGAGAGVEAQHAQRRRCGAIDARRQSIQAAQRAGGSAAMMDALNRRAREIDAQHRSAGC
jgi:hypothetical protein